MEKEIDISFFEKNRPGLLQASSILKMLSNPIRLQILCLLGMKEMSVNEMMTYVSIGQSALSQHLKILRAAELVTFTREHNKLFYRLYNNEVSQIIDVLRKLYCRI